TQRSFIMLSIMLLAICFDRPAVTKRNLALAALVVVATSPDAVVTPGFQMSFAATLALIGGYDVLSRRRAYAANYGTVADGPVLTIAKKGLGLLAGIALTAVIAGLATGIFSAFHFHRIAPWSLVSNVVAMPIITFVTMPSAILAVAAMPFGLDGFVFPVMFSSIDAVIAIADLTADKQGVGLTGAVSPVRMLLLTAGLLLLCVPRTGLRAAAIVPFAFALLPQADSRKPILHVSEDAKQVAAVVFDSARKKSHLAVNRSRPNRFTVDQWAQADRIGTDGLVRPNSDHAISFDCTAAQDICSLSVPLPDSSSGHYELAVAVLAKPEAATRKLCARYDVIIESYAPSKMKCDDDGQGAFAYIVTAKSLALRGSLEVYARAPPPTARADIIDLDFQYALSPELRPWHAQRIYSRSARGLPAYRREGN
ncbi:MAG: ComEC/Rec2 family competence protein, partial [Pseudomonadota bacterium]